MRWFSRSLLFVALLIVSTLLKAQPRVELDSIFVSKVYAAVGVSFPILTTRKYQYVCYFDAEKRMTVAQRELSSKRWKTTILPGVLGWDSHSAIAIAVDKAGFIHISGNMHAVPLVYFRSRKPENITQFDSVGMTGHEDRVTYPLFFKNRNGDLFFQYRNGRSGKGVTCWNKYDTVQQKWSSVYDTPLFDGENQASAYSTSPVAGPDGYFYIVYMWRQTVIANTNQRLSVIRSKDLTNWENIEGRPMSIPVKRSDSMAVVDPVGSWNGLINLEYSISWDEAGQPCITYHKFDRQGISQVFITRYEGGHWQIHQISNWADFTWDLNREGSIGNDVGMSRVRQEGPGLLSVSFHHKKYGSGVWILDPSTLAVKEQREEKVPPYVFVLSSKIKLGPSMVLHRITDNTRNFVMQWQTLAPNQDMAPQPPYPPPSDLVIYDLSRVNRENY